MLIEASTAWRPSLCSLLSRQDLASTIYYFGPFESVLLFDHHFVMIFFQIQYPENVHLIRGNHEAADINALFGFRLECIERMV